LQIDVCIALGDPKRIFPCCQKSGKTSNLNTHKIGAKICHNSLLEKHLCALNQLFGVYFKNEIVKKNSFTSIDQTGVSQLVKIACEKGNATRPGKKLGICGEHGNDPDSVKFSHRIT